eukprot:CAMPEP_0183708754 /NCGR_PEP_ID=MMETSP0737-20130205/4965_1 /TAXON_ID=385413 /ORGANISM="Thalassiosira miniscula, Strain CCMP1093" /LENGTH=1387 /DNA_ID=CAMNT_0025936683 /DNA_START=253 /DNA_END=4416 /DNA_ORIENTATION=+
MDGSANPPPTEVAHQQPDYPPLAQQAEDPYQHHHAAAAAPQQAPHHTVQQQVYQHAAPQYHHSVAAPATAAGGADGGSAMSALTAAAVAAQPAASHTAVSPPRITVPNTVGIQHRPQPAGANIQLTLATPQQQQQPPPPQAQQSPLGKVVESGHEHTGRWTKEEHEAFLAALQLYGKEWKKVAARVKTRTVVQTRTHAQKYFQKLQKVLEAGGDKEANAVLGMVGGSSSGITLAGATSSNPQGPVTHSNIAAMMDLGVPNSEKKSSAKKRGARGISLNTSSVKQPKSKQLTSNPLLSQYQSTQVSSPSAAMSRSSSATAAALLNMSNDRRPSATMGLASTAAAGAYSTHAAPSPHHPQQHGFTTAAPTEASPATSSHGFGYPTAASTGANVTSLGTTPNPLAKPSGAGISLAAIPTHDDMVHSGSKFPDPSPAACGKRKMAEIAAAQMLAGVVRAAEKSAAAAAAGGATFGQPAQKRRASVTGSAAIAAEGSSITQPVASKSVNPAVGEPPPPPPAPAEAGPSAAAVNNNPLSGGMSLQIVNPDTLASQSNGMPKRRLLNGQASPLTPWDGQLEALVSHVQSQEAAPQDPNAANSSPTVNGVSESQVDAQTDPVTDISLLPPPLRSPRSELQIAVCSGSVVEVSQICSTQVISNPSILAERDDGRFHPLHSAAALGMSPHFGPNCSEAIEICQLLIDAGADVTCRDAHGNTPVHWAARAGHGDVLGILLSKSSPLDVQNDAGETALHWAMRVGDGSGAAVKILVENGARVNVFNRNFRRPLDVAAEGFEGLNDEGEGVISSPTKNNSTSVMKVDQRARRETRWNLMRHSSQCRTLVLHHQECLDHLAKSDHDWEVPDRIDNIMTTLKSRTIADESCVPAGDDQETFQSYEITISNEFERATLELLSRIHSAEYLAFVNDLSKELERKRKQHLIEESQRSELGGDDVVIEKPVTVVPFTPMVQRKIMKEAKTKDDGHSDTAFSAGSLKAARRAAGAVQHAVDCVLVGRNRNAFCIVRPPGHHAGINGLLSDAESCGFCLFNNVAAGAMHALSDEKNRPRCERCAIVDIDAHHGNGTEEIVRKCHDSGRLLFFSVHLYDYDKPPKKGKDSNGSGFQYKFYPGTGAEDDVAHNIINVPIAPLWREKEVVKSISLASNGGTPTVEPRQTRQRSKEEAARRVPSLPDLSKFGTEETASASLLKPSSGMSSETASVTSESSAQSSKPRTLPPSSSPHYPPHYLMGVGRLAYRRAIQHRLLPALRAFNPDLIILSTGFDAARGDVGNARHYIGGTEAMGLDLEPEDYAWTARKVCEVADICCDGRVVSVLEGGYGRTPPPVPPPPIFGDGPPAAPVKQKLDKSFFSECAIQHLKGLVDPYYADQQKESSNRKRP